MSENDILSAKRVASLKRTRSMYQREIKERQGFIAEIDAKLAAHETAVYVRDMPEPKIGVGCELAVTEATHEYWRRMGWQVWEIKDWDIGKVLEVRGFDAEHQVYSVRDGITVAGRIPIALAQDMRQAYLAKMDGK